jgi:hypothetical protein
MSLLESDIEKACVRIAFNSDCILLKIQGTKGWPDRVLVTPNGRVAFLEFKRPGGRLTALQDFTLCKLQEMRHRAEKVDSVEEFRLILADLLHPLGSRTNTKPAALTG